MGQGFGKFVGSFMRQVQEGDKKGSSPEEGRSADRSVPRSEAIPARPDRDEERSHQSGRAAAASGERRYLPYRLYDPWEASRWGDPTFGFDPGGRGNSWVDYDWNARKRQYGWSYGGIPPYSEGGGGYGGGYPYGGGYGVGRRNPYYGGGWSPEEWGDDRYGEGWGRDRYDRRLPPAEEGYRSREGSPYGRRGWDDDR